MKSVMTEVETFVQTNCISCGDWASCCDSCEESFSDGDKIICVGSKLSDECKHYHENCWIQKRDEEDMERRVDEEQEKKQEVKKK